MLRASFDQLVRVCSGTSLAVDALDRSPHIEDAVPLGHFMHSLALLPALLLGWCASRDMSARRSPLIVGLELHAEHVVRDSQVTVTAAQHRCGHNRLHLLGHHADIGLVAAVVSEAVEAEAISEVAEKEDVVLEHHVRSPDDTPGCPPRNASHTDHWRNDGRDDRSNDAAGAVDTGGTIDNSICLRCLDREGSAATRSMRAPR
jgi:hypothetical protein